MATVADRRDMGSSPGGCVEAAAPPTVGTPDLEREDSQVGPPQHLGDCHPNRRSPAEGTEVPGRATHFQLISPDPSAACTPSAVASKHQKEWNTLQATHFKGQTGNLKKKSRRTLKSPGRRTPRTPIS